MTTVHQNKPLYLICHKLLGQNKGSYVKRHHETNHKNFSSKLTELKSALASQQRFMKVSSEEYDATTEASFLMS